jgi:2-amino-4-hydroxy-6-hydroxymethyldihydropteridine diphosphokinase
VGRVTDRLVVVALGSNLGDRAAHLHHAVDRLHGVLGGLRVSRFHETAPVGVTGEQPPFLNAAAAGRSSRPAAALLAILLGIEAERGRERPHPGAARTLDLDLVLCGDEVIESLDLTLPHPRFRERAFVLDPLVEIAPDARDPVTGRTMRELHAALHGTVSGVAPSVGAVRPRRPRS